MKFQNLGTFEINSINELACFWRDTLAQYFGSRTLCLLVGPVGAGKTESLKQIYELCGFVGAASPSFAIHHCAFNESGQRLDHVDLYRITDPDDLESTGFWDLFQTADSWIFVEWGDLVNAQAWPLDWPTFRVEIKLDQGKRQVVLSRLLH